MVKYKSPYEGPWASPKPSLFAYPTGDWRAVRPIVNTSKCRHCGICYFQCPVGAIKDMGTSCQSDLSYCKGRGICAAECPNTAIVMVKEEVKVS